MRNSDFFPILFPSWHKKEIALLALLEEGMTTGLALANVA